jgi:creatinine amidohydrolase
MQLAELKWPEVEALPKQTPIVFPIAALEQHGRHLPVFTDSLLTTEIVRRLSERFRSDALFAPLLWLGNSDHHLDFPGTLSVPPRTYIDLLGGLAENAIAHGFRRIFFLNGHGGNEVPGRQALFEVRQRHRDRRDLLLLFGTYWNLVDKMRLSQLGLTQTSLNHACEYETSMVLHLNSKLVAETCSIAPVHYGNPFEPAHRAFTTKDISAPGHVGIPSEATVAKGAALFEAFTDGAADIIRRMIAWNGTDWSG